MRSVSLASEPRALVFDMDGLLVDSEPLWHEVESDVARAHGGRWTRALSAECIGTGLAHAVELMRERLALELPVDEGVAELVARFVERVAELRLQPGSAELVAAAAGRAPLALASSSRRLLIDAVLDRFELTERFDVVVSGEDVAHAKPAPDIFLRAAALLAVPAPACLVLEDSLAGVMAARAAGMPVVAVPESDPAPFRPFADHVVTDLHQVRALLGW
jgi:HAD superfamily hydrolase (TIGR01509 family)